MKTNEIPEAMSRIALLAGDEMMQRLADTRLTVFGVGGVGSWCVEALARSGIGNIRIVDSDVVAESNINRQMPALYSTLGKPKVEVVAQRIADINPAANVTALQARYTPENGESFHLENDDFVIDAIDSLPDKADLILRCTAKDTAPRMAFFSSMGAARKLDPAKYAPPNFGKSTAALSHEHCAHDSAARAYSHSTNSPAYTAPKPCRTASKAPQVSTAPSPTPQQSSASPSPTS